jgi:hypothetical protein
MKGIADKYYPDEILFIKDNFYQMTNNQLLDEINSRRANPVTLSALLHQCRKLNLSKGIQIRWSEKDARYLIDNYQHKGDFELALDFNKRKKTWRVIDGKKVYRHFNKKMVEKKRKLMGLKRTDKEVKAVLKRNLEIGLRPGFTSTDNLWTRGVKKSFKEGEIKLQSSNGRVIRVIKLNGKFIPYTRWFYHNFISPVPDDCNVYHKDMDQLNDDPDNLYMCKKSPVNFADMQIAVELLVKRIEKHFRVKRNDREQEREWQAELTRLRNLMRKVNRKMELIKNNHQKHGRKILSKPRFSTSLPNDRQQPRVVLAKKSATPVFAEP